MSAKHSCVRGPRDRLRATRKAPPPLGHGEAGLTLLLSATLSAAFRAMALATEVDTGAPCGCGRIRLGEGDRLPGPCRLGGPSMCPWAGTGARLCSQASSPFTWGPRRSSLVSGTPALANGFGVGAGGTRRSGGMVARAESTDSPCAERVRTVTALASRLRSRGSSTVALSAMGALTSATCHREHAHRRPGSRTAPPPAPERGGPRPGPQTSHSPSAPSRTRRSPARWRQRTAQGRSARAAARRRGRSLGRLQPGR